MWTPRSLKAGVARADQNGFGKVFQYDGAGRVLGVARRPAALFGLANNTVPTGDLIASAPEAENFEYDAAQNLLRSKERKNETETTVETPPDASGRNRPASIGGRVLEWDANGNLKQKDNLRFAYDWRNRLKKVTRADNGDLVAIYSYDVFNRRVKKEVGGQTYGYAWDGWNQIEDSLNGPSEVRNRRVYGLGLDNALRMDFDLNGSGGPDVQYVPVYDGIGNLVALTNSAGKPIESYEYSAYGKQKIFVDGAPPQINQIRKVGSTFFIEMSEEVSLTEIQRQIAENHIKLVGTGVGGSYSLTATQPIQDGPLARRRIALTTGATIAADQEVTLTIGAETLVDSFLNAAPGTANVHTFDWELEGILEDNTAPNVERIAVRAGRIEIDFDEMVDATLAAQAITVDGGVVAWTLASSGYRMVADVALTVGSHEVEIGTGAVDLASKGLSTAVDYEVAVGTEAFASVFEAPNVRELSASTANNPFGFHGLPSDFETGLSYVRNRYYDTELGRFVSTDPLGYIDGPSVYAFGGFNPQNAADPLGLEQVPGVSNTHAGAPPCYSWEERAKKCKSEESEASAPEPEEASWFASALAWVGNGIKDALGGQLAASAEKTEKSAQKFGDEFSNSTGVRPAWADDDNANTPARWGTESTAAAGKSVRNSLELAGQAGKTAYSATETAANVKVAKQLLEGVGGLAATILKKSADGPGQLPDVALVCRGGVCLEANFTNGSGITTDANGLLSGVSVQSAPATSVEELIVEGQIKNGQIGVTTVGKVRSAGGDVIPTPTPKNKYHCDVCGITAAEAEELFTPTIPNPAKKKP